MDSIKKIECKDFILYSNNKELTKPVDCVIEINEPYEIMQTKDGDFPYNKSKSWWINFNFTITDIISYFLNSNDNYRMEATGKDGNTYSGTIIGAKDNYRLMGSGELNIKTSN